jgi:hypothetical protein
MKKIILILLFCFVLNWCSQEIQNKENISHQDNQQDQIEKEIEAYNAAQQTLNEIETTSQQEISQALQDFHNQQDINYDLEIQKTLTRYNDNFWPILEYKHEPKPEEENNDDEINSNESETQTWSITEENQEVWDDENTDNQQDPTNDSDELDDKDYSDEVDIPDTEENKSEEFTTTTKVWKSWTYISYTPQSGKCNGWLKMVDTEKNEKWLFYNTCDKIIYDFELDFWGINVFFKDENGTQWETFVTIE